MNAIVCPYCSTVVYVMVALNHRLLVVHAGSVDELLCHRRKGRLVFEPKAGHVRHTCPRVGQRSARQLLDAVLAAERGAERPRMGDSPWLWPGEVRGAYGVLQLDMGASREMAKSAFRRLSRQYHPDVNPHGLAQMQCITQAYEVLKRRGLA